MKRSRVSRLGVAAVGIGLGLGVGLAAAAPARATTDVIQRSFENMPQGIADALLAPVTSGRSIYSNLQNVGDTTGVRVAYTVPGFVWNTMCNFGGGLIRSVTGVLELPIGLALLFTDAEMEPLFDPVEDSEALFTLDQWEDTYRVKVGVLYTSGG